MNPTALARFTLLLVTRIFYRIRPEGAARLPVRGAGLLVSNHLSFIDAFLISGACPRPVRFLMYRSYFEAPGLSWFFKAMGAIPISDKDSPKSVLKSFEAVRESLGAGDLVCIFAEGSITRHGQMLRFKKGFERMVKGMSVPVIPVHLDRVWGSVFSFEGGQVLLKRPRRLPYPITVSFGEPLPSTATAHQVRQAIMDLGATAFGMRIRERLSLGLEFAATAKRRWRDLAMRDSSGRVLTFGQALTRAVLFAAALRRRGRADSVALALPGSADGALACLGTALAGKTAVLLNPDRPAAVLEERARRAGAERIVAERKLLQKLGVSGSPWLAFEDLAGPSRLERFAVGLMLRLVPASLLEKLIPAAAVPLERPAAVLFTSGSTGPAKGVVLSHANILSNIEGVAQIYQLSPEDRLAAALPLHHAFGLTATLWLPAICGQAVLRSADPADARALGKLAEEGGATFLLGTPSQLGLWLGAIDARSFRTVKTVIVGGERLKDELAKAFQERFGLPPLEGYGTTELSPIAAVNIPDVDWPTARQTGSKLGTIGQPLPGVVFRVVDPSTGADLPPGETGLLLVKGPNLMIGYLEDAQATARVIKDGCFVTGDLGSLDPDGFVTVAGRA